MGVSNGSPSVMIRQTEINERSWNNFFCTIREIVDSIRDSSEHAGNVELILFSTIKVKSRGDA